MAMPATFPERSVWTADDIADLPPDGQRYELLHGELVVSAMPVPAHQTVALSLAVLFHNAAQALPMTVIAPAELHVSRTTVLEPDVAVYPVRDAVRDDWRSMPKPALVIEVLSPSTLKHDRHRKRPEYLGFGVAEVWTVDLTDRCIERWTAASEFPTVERTDFDFALTPAHPPVRITLQTVFGTPSA